MDPAPIDTRLHLDSSFLENIERITLKTYKVVLLQMKEHLTLLTNPYVAMDILESLKKYNGECALDATDFYRDFIDLFAPQETKILLQSFSDKLKECIYDPSHTLTESDDALKKILLDFKQLVDEIEPIILEKKTAHSEELRVLLSIPQIKLADNQQIESLLQYIHKDQKLAFQDLVKKLCMSDPDYKVNSLEGKYGDYDWSTFEDELFNPCAKNLEENESVSFWDHSPDFFVNKILCFCPSEIGETLNKAILSTERLGQNLIFHLEDRSVLQISYPGVEVRLDKKRTYKKLWSELLASNLTKGETVEVQHTADTIQKTEIPEGIYTIGKSSTDWEENKTNKTGYHTITLDISESNGYLLKTNVIDGYVTDIDVYSIERNEKKFLFQTTPQQFDYKYFALKTTEIRCSSINKGNINQFVAFYDDDSKDGKKFYLEELKRRTSSISSNLMKENHELLEICIDHLIKNGLLKIDLSSIPLSQELSRQRANLLEKVDKLSERYREDVKINRTSEEILIQIVQEANHAKLVNKENNVLPMIELLFEANKYVDKMEKRDLVLCMGESGSGKSTAIASFLKAKLEEINRAGNKVWKISDGDQENRYPKIGLSLVASETTYTRGYLLPNTEVMLVDSVGSNENRQGDYELSANFSLDETVKAARQIKSLVVALPANAVLNNSDDVMRVINAVQERFPRAFSEHIPPTYLLITQTDLAQTSLVKSIIDGSRFQSCLKHTQAYISNLETQGQRQGDFEFDAWIKKKIVWDSLFKMCLSKKVNEMNLRNQKQRDGLIKCYSQTHNQTKEEISYQKTMNSVDMKRRLGKYVQQAVHTWTHLIFDQYLNYLPKMIKECEEHINKNIESKILLQNELDNRKIEVEKCREYQETLESVIQILQKGDYHALAPELQRDLQEKINIASNKGLVQERSNLQKVINDEDKAVKLFKDLVRIQSELKEEIRRKEQEILSLLSEINVLKQGKTKIELHCTPMYKFDDTIDVKIFNPQQFQEENERSINAIQPIDINRIELKGNQRYKVQDYEGISSHIAIIDKKYQICPSGPIQRPFFEIFRCALDYDIQVEGEGYEFTGTRVDVDGKKVAHSYNLIWNHGSPFPWMKIFHVIPNRHINSATIINKQTDINCCQEVIAKFKKSLTGTEGITGISDRIEEKNNDMRILGIKKLTIQKKIKRLEKSNAVEQISNFLEEKKIELEETKIEIKNLENPTEIIGKISNLEKEIELIKKQSMGLHFLKKRYAMIIKNQLETITFLRHLSEVFIGITSGPNQEFIKAFDDADQACHAFNSIYDTEFNQLEKKVNHELGLCKDIDQPPAQMTNHSQILKNDQGDPAGSSICNSFSKDTNVTDLL